ncbi:MAG: AsmA family protein, partial [Bacteroidetes bacterium]|nr:AsmA family protein [Bacteroidota bacterium]
MLKKLLKIFGIILVLLIAAAIIIPIAFKGKIMAKVQEEANKQLNANFSFDDIDISLFRNFPNLSVELENLSIVNKAPFQGDTLVAASSIGFSAGLFDLFADDMSIKSIRINKGNINITVLEDGTASYDIAKDKGDSEGAESSEESSFKLKLKYYEISETKISYDDRSLGFKTTLANLNHSGSGDFTADNTKLDTQTNIDKLDVWYDGVHYLNKALIDYKAIFDLDLKNSKYSFLENELKLNDLALRFAGYVSMPGDDIDMDITFEALQNEVKSFLSLVPGTYTADFKDVKSGGKLSFKGFVKGKYNDNTIPGFDLHLNIADGSVQYPSLPRSLKNMQVVCAVTCP